MSKAIHYIVWILINWINKINNIQIQTVLFSQFSTLVNSEDSFMEQLIVNMTSSIQRTQVDRMLESRLLFWIEFLKQIAV